MNTITFTSPERPRLIKSATEQIGEAIHGLLETIDAAPELVLSLDDGELLALDAWEPGHNEVITAECRRRKAQHEQQVRRFTSCGQAELWGH